MFPRKSPTAVGQSRSGHIPGTGQTPAALFKPSADGLVKVGHAHPFQLTNNVFGMQDVLRGRPRRIPDPMSAADKSSQTFRTSDIPKSSGAVSNPGIAKPIGQGGDLSALGKSSMGTLQSGGY